MYEYIFGQLLSEETTQRQSVVFQYLAQLLREGNGQYRIHPIVMWKGELAKWEKAAAVSPPLSLIDGGKRE